jgi:hypothetical protein
MIIFLNDNEKKIVFLCLAEKCTNLAGLFTFFTLDYSFLFQIVNKKEVILSRNFKL